MSAPRLPFREPDFSWHPGNVFDLDDPEAPWHGAFEQGATLEDQGLERLVHAIVAPGAGYDRPGVDLSNVNDRMRDIESANRDVTSVISDIRSAQTAFGAGGQVWNAISSAGGGGRYRPEWGKIGMETYASVQLGLTAAEAGAVALTVGEELLVGYAFHEARNIADPLLAGDTFGDKLLNAALASIGVNESHFVGDYRPENPFANALPAELELERYNVSHWSDSSLAANVERSRLAALVAQQRAERDAAAKP